MPVPRDLQNLGNATYYMGNFPLTFNNPHQRYGGRARLTKNFYVYLEVVFQAKHDRAMYAYCRSIGIQPRNNAGTQVGHNYGPNDAFSYFYPQKAHIAANVSLGNMLRRWGSARNNPGVSVFTPEVRVDAAVQGIVQEDGYSYEISYWYDNDNIYVLFHCYPSVGRR